MSIIVSVLSRKSVVCGVSGAILLVVGLVTSSASALEMETYASKNTASGFMENPQGPAGAGAIFSQATVASSEGATLDFASDPYARATANDTGYAAVGANGMFWDGTLFLNSLAAQATLVDSYTNNLGVNVAFDYNFILPGPSLRLGDWANVADTDKPSISASFSYGLTLDSTLWNQTSLYSSNAILRGGMAGHTLTTGGMDTLAATAVGDPSLNNVFGYDFASLVGGVSGVIEPGETLTFTSLLYVGVDAPGFETGGSAFMGNPNLLGAGFSRTFSVSPVPEPFSLLLLGSGLAGLLGVKGRKKNITT